MFTKGFFNMAKARYSMGPQSVCSHNYDTVMRASCLVEVEPDRDETDKRETAGGTVFRVHRHTNTTANVRKSGTMLTCSCGCVPVLALFLYKYLLVFCCVMFIVFVELLVCSVVIMLPTVSCMFVFCLTEKCAWSCAWWWSGGRQEPATQEEAPDGGV